MLLFTVKVALADAVDSLPSPPSRHSSLHTEDHTYWKHLQLSAGTLSPDFRSALTEGAEQVTSASVKHDRWKLVKYPTFLPPQFMPTLRHVLHHIPEFLVGLSPSCPHLIVGLKYSFPLLVPFIFLTHFPTSQQCLQDHLHLHSNICLQVSFRRNLNETTIILIFL